MASGDAHTSTYQCTASTNCIIGRIARRQNSHLPEKFYVKLLKNFAIEKEKRPQRCWLYRSLASHHSFVHC